jgi:signal transduction histidine kinase
MQQYFNVFLVEDCPSDAFLVKAALAETNYIRFDLEWVQRLSQALERQEGQPFDVVLLDLDLPDSEGPETLFRLRRQAAAVPIVVLTGPEDEALGLRLIQEGADDYLVKGRCWGEILVRSIRYAVECRRKEEALREAARCKNDFLAMLAHELRNPLAPIRNAVEVLKRPSATDSYLQWARDLIDRQLTHLTRMVDDLLDVSRLTHNMAALQRETMELAPAIEQAVEMVAPLMESRRHELVVSMPPDPVRIEGDAQRISQAVFNLLDNAAKYTDEGGRILLSLEVEEREAVIRVKDSGVGISAALLPHVFELFVQSDRSLDRPPGGLGIGLTLVKRIVEMHGGQVEAHSGGVGAGSEFVMRLAVSG